MASDVDSDTETVLGGSPLSPCVWTSSAIVQPFRADGSNQQETLSMVATDPTTSVVPAPDGAATALPPRRKELVLSPASQLDVLSQISTLSVNEDLIVATAESQTERDLEGVIAYQRILHRNLMEMADFVDSTFGVYSNTISKVNSQIYTKTKENCDVQPRVDVNVTTEPVEKERPIVLNSTYEVTKTQTNKASKGVLFTALEAGEKVREVQRSKEQWIKSRDQEMWKKIRDSKDWEGWRLYTNCELISILRHSSTPPKEAQLQQLLLLRQRCTTDAVTRGYSRKYQSTDQTKHY
ncbi:hypothetical protein PHYBOEH_008157 [Phytophthora boehmeriae]|uniref:Uncharacterized protein n=1 Tax=Phytophthora boehmeriae TaxID=109152 RepID=A0A8T1W4Z1_9STRA|nr:hypothetical protein PHYBOEH_008157 [Phytophthora boehmeriae]